MKNLLFYTYWNFKESTTNGICKKIQSQRKVFEDVGYEVDLCYMIDENYYIEKKGKKELINYRNSIWTKPFSEYKLSKYLKKNTQYDYAYFRYAFSEPGLLSLLKVLKKNGTKIILELPTVEYENELGNSLRDKICLYVDRLYRKKLKKYVQKVVVYQDYDVALGIKTIKTFNGVDVSGIPINHYKGDKEVINLIGVGQLSPWHGFDRIINGLKKYYNGKYNTIVNFYIVGNGLEYDKYNNIISDNNLSDHVFLCGPKNGKELDEIFSEANIAVSSIGLHRIGIFDASPLKAREYGARGMLMISSCKIDFLEDDKSVFYVPADDSDVNIQEVVSYYNSISENHDLNELSEMIHEETRRNADIAVTMKSIIKEFEKEG